MLALRKRQRKKALAVAVAVAVAAAKCRKQNERWTVPHSCGTVFLFQKYHEKIPRSC